jgi:hypothetical protein
LKEEGHTHNPHYYEFMRRNGGVVPRAPGDNPGGAPHEAQCGIPNLPSLIQVFRTEVIHEFNALLTGWRNYHDRQSYVAQGHVWPPHWRAVNHNNTIITPWERPDDLKKHFDSELKYLVALTTFHRSAVHLHGAVLRVLHINPPENHTLRVQFMLGEISEDFLKTTVQRRDKAYRKDVAKSNVYQMAFHTVSDIFREFVNSPQHSIEEMHKAYSHILEIYTYANLCFSKIEKAYTCTIEPYTINPFLTTRWM